jgi:hypothetical protein
MSKSGKIVTSQNIIGQQGANLIERITLAMRFVWRPIVIFDVGIDGEIEVCDPVTGEATNSVIRVQAKTTTQPFQAETQLGFEFTCDERDLDYWLRGNTPVILIVCRPATSEAYWVDIKAYFSDLHLRKTRKVYFDKKQNVFDENAASKLTALALPKESGLYFSPLALRETIYTNLLRVTSYAKNIYIASTDYRTPNAVWAEFKSRGIQIGSEWILKNKQILSFYDLDEPPFNSICDEGTVERFDASEWAEADDTDKMNEFIFLLKSCLKQRARQLGLYHDKERDLFYFPATKRLQIRKISYKGLRQNTSREVFKAYNKKNAPNERAYCRHAAFKSKFVRLDNVWYLELTPTYHFTRDGRYPDKYRGEHTSGIKRLERNPAVFGQLLMWEYVLRTPRNSMLSNEYPFLTFGDFEKLEIEGGIPDDMWNRTEEGIQAQSMNSEANQLRLLGL